MDTTIEISNDNILKAVGLELMFCTPEKCTSEYGITAIELARKLNIPTDTVKKKLKILYEKKIIRVTGVNPKYWKFDDYQFQKMDENDEVYKLISDFENVDFSKYFEY